MKIAKNVSSLGTEAVYDIFAKTKEFERDKPSLRAQGEAAMLSADKRHVAFTEEFERNRPALDVAASAAMESRTYFWFHP